MISTKTHLILFGIITLSINACVAMYKGEKEFIVINDQKIQHFLQQRGTKITRPYGYNIPKEGAKLFIDSEFYKPSSANLTINIGCNFIRFTPLSNGNINIETVTGSLQNAHKRSSAKEILLTLQPNSRIQKQLNNPQ